eukprot:3270445-Prymnesium_polylepis.2
MHPPPLPPVTPCGQWCDGGHADQEGCVSAGPNFVEGGGGGLITPGCCVTASLAAREGAACWIVTADGFVLLLFAMGTWRG